MTFWAVLVSLILFFLGQYTEDVLSPFPPSVPLALDALEGYFASPGGEGGPPRKPTPAQGSNAGPVTSTPQIRPTSFFQVSTRANERLMALIRELGGIGPATLALDLCCGTGERARAFGVDVL